MKEVDTSKLNNKKIQEQSTVDTMAKLKAQNEKYANLVTKGGKSNEERWNEYESMPASKLIKDPNEKKKLEEEKK